MSVITFIIDEEHYSAKEGDTILQVARDNKIHIPTLCYLDGLSTFGACRLCVVEIEGSPKLLPACTTKPTEGMIVRTNTERLKKYRRMIVELLASEGSHQCAVCVVNGHCELQNLAYEVGLDHVRFPYLFPIKLSMPRIKNLCWIGTGVFCVRAACESVMKLKQHTRGISQAAGLIAKLLPT